MFGRQGTHLDVGTIQGSLQTKPGKTYDVLEDKSSFIDGKNPKVKKDRTLTDLDPFHDRSTAKSIFRNQTKGQKVEKKNKSDGTIIRIADDGTQIRMNPDGTTRLDLPGRYTQPNGEAIHFNGKK